MPTNHIATAPKDLQNAIAITPGMSYLITRFDNPKDETQLGRTFWVINDNGMKIFCLERECAHLRGGNWTISNKSAKEADNAK